MAQRAEPRGGDLDRLTPMHARHKPWRKAVNSSLRELKWPEFAV